MKKKVIGVIPARFGSTRLEGKPLIPIKGKPMIEWVIRGTQKSKLLNEIFVATDDVRIAEVAQKCGVKAVMTPSELPTGTDRIWQAVQNIDADIVINIQGDEPLITGNVIDSLAEPLLQDEKLSMATLAHEISLEELNSPNVVKVILDQFNNGIYFSRFAIPYTRAEAKAPFACFKHVGLYGYRKSFLKIFCETPMTDLEKLESLEQLRALYLGEKIRVIKTAFKSVGVDVAEDILKVEKFL